MAEQNIIAGDIKLLEQIIGDVSEHNEKKGRLESLNSVAKDLTDNIENSEKTIKQEIEKKIKESVAAICDSFDKAIAEDKQKIKAVQVERDKAKIAGVNERISNETSTLRQKNEELKDETKQAFLQAKVPMLMNTRYFMALFCSNGAVDIAIFVATILIFFGIIPVGLSFIPNLPIWAIAIYCFVVSSAFVVTVKLIYDKIVINNYDVIISARSNKMEIAGNNKKINKIKKGIQKDKSEEMYGLESFDDEIEGLNQHISSVEKQKEAALEEFENTTKKDIIADIDSRYRKNIETMQVELEKKQNECRELDSLVKEQRIYISSNYEAYLGKEFMNIDKLKEMHAIMKRGTADTIGQAISAYKVNH